MTSLDLLQRVLPFMHVPWAESEDGYIVWRMGTGNNTELLHIKVKEPGNGGGSRLLKLMLLQLQQNPPYATVFGFTRAGNLAAHFFYEQMGFTLSPVQGVYDEGAAVVFAARFDDLCKRHLEDHA